MERIWKQSVFGFLGIRNYHRRMFSIVADSTESERVNWLEMVKENVKRIVER